MTAAALVCLEPEIGSHGDVTSPLRYSVMLPTRYLRPIRSGVEQTVYYCITELPFSATGMLRLDEANRILCAGASRLNCIERLPEAAVCAGAGRTEADGR